MSKLVLLGITLGSCLLATAASAQLVVLPSTQEVYDRNGPAEAEFKLGSDWNIRLGPVSLDPTPGHKRKFTFENGVPVSIVLEHFPVGAEDPGYVLRVGTSPQNELEFEKGAAGLPVDLLMIDSDSQVPGASVALVNPQLLVPVTAGVGGSLPVAVGADDSNPEQILSVSGPDLREGFVFTASVVFTWVEPLPEDPIVRIRIRTQQDEDLDTDRDRDGIPNEIDNCPDTHNPDQADSEVDPMDPMTVIGDGVGDACDNCPAVINPDQLNFDEDSFGEACDTCPDGCTVNPREASGEDCSNEEQADPSIDDPDGDGVGRICDNCPDEANADQADGDPTTPEGDACENPGGGMEGGGVAGASAGSKTTEQAPLLDDVRRIRVNCGGENLTAASLAVRVPEFPGNVTAVRFGIDRDSFDLNSGCILDPTLGFSKRISPCDAAAGLDPAVLKLDQDGALPPGDPNSRQTIMRGPQVTDPLIDDNLVILQLFGDRTEPGFTDKILCLEGENLDVGLIRFFGLVSGTPSLTTDGLDAFAPPLPPLDIADDGTVPLEGLTFTTGPPEGSQAFDLTLGPTFDDPTGDTEQQLTLLSLGPLVQEVALCLKAPGPVATADMGFADCTLPGALPYQRTCPANTPPDVDLGPLVDLTSFVIPPNQSVAGTGVPASLDEDMDGFAPDDAVCVVLSGTPNLHDPEVDSLLGKVRYFNTAVGIGLPRIEFPPGLLDDGEGNGVPGVMNFFEADQPVGPGEVRVVGSFDVDGDDDFDGVFNFSDNCTKVPNFDQLNTGSILEILANSDPVGDVCTCCDGELINNGSCFQPDLAACQKAFADQEAGLDPGPGAARCSVTGGPELDALDIAFLGFVLKDEGGETAEVQFKQVCPAATGSE